MTPEDGESDDDESLCGSQRTDPSPISHRVRNEKTISRRLVRPSGYSLDFIVPVVTTRGEFSRVNGRGRGRDTMPS